MGGLSDFCKEAKALSAMQNSLAQYEKCSKFNLGSEQ
jgi:hypothetical protein